MASICYSSIKGLMMRATRLDECGVPVSGDCNAVVTKGFVNVGLTAEVDEGETYEVKLADGTYCINEKDCPVLRWLNLEMEFCEVDPELFSMVSGARSLVDFAGDTVGFTQDETPRCQQFALEVWTQVAGQSGCDNATCPKRWIYWLLPTVANGSLGDFTIENGPMSFTLSGNTKSSSIWGCGPYDVVAVDAACTPGPLIDPVLPGEHLYQRLTEIAPPAPTCGCVSVEIPMTAGAYDGNCAA